MWIQLKFIPVPLPRQYLRRWANPAQWDYSQPQMSKLVDIQLRQLLINNRQLANLDNGGLQHSLKWHSVANPWIWAKFTGKKRNNIPIIGFLSSSINSLILFNSIFMQIKTSEFNKFKGCSFLFILENLYFFSSNCYNDWGELIHFYVKIIFPCQRVGQTPERTQSQSRIGFRDLPTISSAQSDSSSSAAKSTRPGSSPVRGPPQFQKRLFVQYLWRNMWINMILAN